MRPNTYLLSRPDHQAILLYAAVRWEKLSNSDHADVLSCGPGFDRACVVGRLNQVRLLQTLIVCLASQGIALGHSLDYKAVLVYLASGVELDSGLMLANHHAGEIVIRVIRVIISIDVFLPLSLVYTVALRVWKELGVLCSVFLVIQVHASTRRDAYVR